MPICSYITALLLAVIVLISACAATPFTTSGEAPPPVNPYGFNYSTVQIIPPSTTEGKACSQTCLQTLAQCQNRCQATAAACGGQTGGSKCTTTQCDADCTISYRACHIKCGGQVVVKPARSKQ